MAASTSAAPALLVQDLRKHYGDVRAVDGLDLSVAPGECFGLLGPNGAGKTTTIEVCEGLLAPDSGRVRCEQAFAHFDRRRLARAVWSEQSKAFAWRDGQVESVHG